MGDNTTEKTVPEALSGQETIKRESKFLKGRVAEELADLSRGDVSDETYELLKFHGSYFGHNRDTATERKKLKLEKEYEFMVRTRIPGGRLNAQQYLALDDIAGKYANGTLRITTRQVFQFHVILKENLKKHIAAINHTLLSTTSGCGDVTRNITCSPAPYKNAKYARLLADVDRVAAFVKPKSSAYREIFLDEEADELRERDVVDASAIPPFAKGDDVGGTEYEPLYGATYMPRKFKIGLILPEDNVIDVFTHDLGIVLMFEGDVLKGYNLLVGGGMGMKHEAAVDWDDKKTYPRLAEPLAFVGPDDLLNAVEAVVKLQRDYGDRADRQHARLKYVVQEQGIAWVRKTFEEYFAKTNPKAKAQDFIPVAKYEIPEHMGWHEQGDGKLFLGLKIPSGRIMDYDKPHPSGYSAENNAMIAKARYRSGLRKLFETYPQPIVLMPTGEMIISDIRKEDVAGIEKILGDFAIPLHTKYSPMQLHFFTCVALPTCAKALSESERVQFTIMDGIQEVLEKHGVGKERMTIRVTGCPNGCARPYVGDIGIVGRAPGRFVLFIGGDFEGTRLNKKVFDMVPLEDLTKALDPMVALYAKEKQSGEGFGDYCERVGVAQLIANVKPQLSQYKWAA